MSRNLLYVLLGGLIVATAVLSYQLYQDRKQPSGVQLNIGEKGISIEQK